MIRKGQLLFCDNEHGNGDVTFPDIATLSTFEIQQKFIEPDTIRSLRKEARKAGWGRVNGGDYCPYCMENM